MIFIDKHRKRPTLMPYWFESLCRYKSCKCMKILSTENIFMYWSHIFVCPAFFKAMTHTRECTHTIQLHKSIFFSYFDVGIVCLYIFSGTHQFVTCRVVWASSKRTGKGLITLKTFQTSYWLNFTQKCTLKTDQLQKNLIECFLMMLVRMVSCYQTVT